MAKNLVSGLILACFGPNLDPTDFFRAFRHHWKLMNQLEKMAKNIVSGRQFFFSKIWPRQSLDIQASYHHVQYQ